MNGKKNSVAKHDPFSRPGVKGSAIPLEKAEAAYLKAQLLKQPDTITGFPVCICNVPIAFSYANPFDFSVRNSESGAGFHGVLQLAANVDGGPMEAGLEFALVGDEQRHVLGGMARLDDQILRLELASENGHHVFLGTLIADDFVADDGIVGSIVYCPVPIDPCLNGDVEMKPAGNNGSKKEKSDKGFIATVEYPRLDENGNPVYEGRGPHRKMVKDRYFWRDGMWWRIKDTTLRARGQPGLIDLRDGTGNPNYEKAKREIARSLDAAIYPAGWDKFWKGFDKATARQLQGLAVTLAATTGVDIDLWTKIKKERDRGDSWDEIWERYKWRILFAVVLLGTMKVLMGRIFGRHARKLEDEIGSSGLPPRGRRPPGFGDKIRRWIEELKAERERIRREMAAISRNYNKPGNSKEIGRRMIERRNQRLKEISDLLNELEK